MRKNAYFPFADLEKAFDCVPRTVWPCINNIFSEVVNLSVGVHQGPVLSPLLFIIAMEASPANSELDALGICYMPMTWLSLLLPLMSFRDGRRSWIQKDSKWSCVHGLMPPSPRFTLSSIHAVFVRKVSVQTRFFAPVVTSGYTRDVLGEKGSWVRLRTLSARHAHMECRQIMPDLIK